VPRNDYNPDHQKEIRVFPRYTIETQ